MHAALGEPVRLAMAEALALGDLSGKELAETFGLPTNLLAHHLRVMEDAHLIVRQRSEGDGRRSYVHLRADLPWKPAGLSRPPPSRLLFVCTQNSARSQLAAAEWNRTGRLAAASAGTHPADRVHRRAIQTAKRHGLSLDHAATSQVEMVHAAGDLVVAVCDRAHEELAASDVRDALHWSIPDPVRRDTAAAFEAAYVVIKDRVHRLAGALQEDRESDD